MNLTNNSLDEKNEQFSYFWFKKKSHSILLLMLIAISFYITTIYNETVFDDGINIHQNGYVLKGVRGIPEILTNDTYQDFYSRMNAGDQLQGGRYRPLTTISFALEQEFIHSYRTGYYNFCADLDKNGELGDSIVSYTNNNGSLTKNYEYNEYEDANCDGKITPNECINC
ncbi:MAG: hypothetical protein AB7O73_02385, partial [Bacteroidia bacterium]